MRHVYTVFESNKVVKIKNENDKFIILHYIISYYYIILLY